MAEAFFFDKLKTMIAKIVKGYKNLFLSAAKMLGLLLVCAATGTIFVLPLWKFAMTAPEAYSLVILIILAAAFIFWMVKKVKSAGARNSLRNFLRFLAVAVGFAACVASVLSGNRILAIPALILAVILYGVFSFGIKATKKEDKDEA